MIDHHTSRKSEYCERMSGKECEKCIKESEGNISKRRERVRKCVEKRKKFFS